MVLTEKGFNRPTFDELLNRQMIRAKQLFGEDIDTSSQSILGKFIRINVYDLAECYELLEDIYYARFPGSARGQSLDRLCTFAGIVRNPATATRLRVTVKGNAGAVIAAGTLVDGGTCQYYADNDYTIGVTGMVEAGINCTETGIIGTITSGDLLSLVNLNPDVTAVELVGIAVYGQEKETDIALRLRFDTCISGTGSATSESIRSAVYRVALVEGVAILENDSDKTVDTRPPHSFECYVLAPASQDSLIAEAIFSKKPLGIKCVGAVELPVLDKGGKTHTIRFSRTLKKQLRFRLSIRTNQYFETDGVKQIKASLCDYVNNLANGESVYLTSLYGYVHGVHGVLNVQSLEVSIGNQTYQKQDVAIGEHEIARTELGAIEIEVAS